MQEALNTKRALFIILTTLFIDAVGVGLTFPLMPGLMARVGAGDLASGAIWAGVLMSAYAAAQFVFGPIVGALSDRFGRKPVLITAMAVLALDYVVMASATTYWLVFAARFTAGIAGATYVTATAYLADISPPEERAARFGLVGAVFGLGFVLGPAIGGLLGAWHLSAPFWLAAAVSALNGLLAIAILPESLAPGKRRAFARSDLNPFASIAKVLALPGVGAFLVVLTVFEFANMVYPALWAFWGEALGWDRRLIGLTLATYGIGVALVQAVILPRLVRLFGEGQVAVFGLMTGIIAAMAFGFASAPLVVLLLIPFASLSDMLPAALTGLMSRQVEEDRQGLLQGVIASLGSLAAVFGPLVMTPVFRAGADDIGRYFPGAGFVLAAGIMVLALPFLMMAARRL